MAVSVFSFLLHFCVISSTSFVSWYVYRFATVVFSVSGSLVSSTGATFDTPVHLSTCVFRELTLTDYGSACFFSSLACSAMFHSRVFGLGIVEIFKRCQF